MILVDTSVWVDHLRKGDERLNELLYYEQVVCHPLVIGELACGNLGNRREIIALLSSLPQAHVAQHSEAIHLLESRKLYGRGLGWVDIHLLASAMLTQCSLWTLDKILAQSAKTLRISA